MTTLNKIDFCEIFENSVHSIDSSKIFIYQPRNNRDMERPDRSWSSIHSSSRFVAENYDICSSTLKATYLFSHTY